MRPTPPPVSREQLADFSRDGFLIARGLADKPVIAQMRRLALADLEASIEPVEYEADVRYPGAPDKREAAGGNTARRLLHAYDRSAVFRDWALDPTVCGIARSLLRSDSLALTRSHHNCVMTKHPGFSSATLWHQDLRYWSFTRPDLVNAWLALGDETLDNGCLWLLPGSHRIVVQPQQLDEPKFLRTDLAANRELINTARPAKLRAGDVLFFHAGVFHAAGRNETDGLKLSTVFTYHAADNRAIAGSKSERYASVPAV